MPPITEAIGPEQTWLAVAQPARRALHDVFDFDDMRSPSTQVAAILILNALAARADCPQRFSRAAGTATLPPEGLWGPAARRAYRLLVELTLVSPARSKRKKNNP